MRHQCKKKSLNRAADQQRALVRSLAREVITHGQIQTTLSKAKILRPYLEKLLTKAIKSTKESEAALKLHYIRLIRRELAADVIGSILEKAQALAERPGGYTRILKLGQRRGDATQMAILQILAQ
jgi:large subunit ribosomal protein L17